MGLGRRGGPGGEEAPGGVVQKGLDRELVALGEVEEVDYDQVGEALQILEPLQVVRHKLQPAPDPLGPAGLDGRPLGIGDGRADEADGFDGGLDHLLRTLRKIIGHRLRRLNRNSGRALIRVMIIRHIKGV